MVRDKQGRKGREHDEEQQGSVQEKKCGVYFLDVVEHVVMVHPHYEYGHKASDKGEESWPLVQQSLEQCRVSSAENRIEKRILEIQN